MTSTATFDVVDGSAIVPVAVAEDDVPNINVSIEVVGSTPRTADDGALVDDAPERPAFATGTVTLPVSTASRTLDVTVTPADAQLAPGADDQLDVAGRRPGGAPVAGADLLVVVVDEAVLALSGYELADPASSFYADLPTEVDAPYGRDGIVLVDPGRAPRRRRARRRRRRSDGGGRPTTAAAARRRPAAATQPPADMADGEAAGRRRPVERAPVSDRPLRCAPTSTPSPCSPPTSRRTPTATPPSTCRSPTTSPATA